MSINEQKSLGESNIDAFGSTVNLPVDNKLSQTADMSSVGAETESTEVHVGSPREFAVRLLELCGERQEGKRIIASADKNADTQALAHAALQDIYAGHDDCIPHVEPFFFDREVIERLFFGDKGLFLRFLGKGGFGSAVLVRNTEATSEEHNEVWKIAKKPGAYDGKTQRWHSVHTGDSDSEAWMERLNREAEAFDVLGKEDVSPRLKDKGTLLAADGKEHPYFSTEFVPGMTMKQLMRAEHSGATPSQLTADMGVLYGIQLSRAHHLGFVHRDISSGNLFIADDGRALILDWGIASRGRSNAITMVGSIMGTPEAMAPEVARGFTVDANDLSDVYSLTTVLYEMQTGRLLFDGEDGRQLIFKHQSAERDLTLLKNNVPKAMAEIFEAALSINAAKRPDAEKLARLLYPHSSLYLKNGKMPFDEFVKEFAQRGRLNLPHHEGNTAIPSRFVTASEKSERTMLDLHAESESGGTAMYEALSARTAGVVRTETRKKVVQRTGIVLAASVTIGLAAAAFMSGKTEKASDTQNPITEVQPDPNAPIKEIFSMIEIETLPDGRSKGIVMFRSKSYQINLDGKDVVILHDEAGTHAFVFRLTGPQALALLGYADKKDFPSNDELPNIPEKGLEGDCVAFIDTNTGRSVTYFSPLNTWVIVESDSGGRVYSHRNDVKASLGSSFESPSSDVTQDPGLQHIIRSFPRGMKECTDPNSPGPGGAPRSFAASIPDNIASQLISQFPVAEDSRLETSRK